MVGRLRANVGGPATVTGVPPDPGAAGLPDEFSPDDQLLLADQLNALGVHGHDAAQLSSTPLPVSSGLIIYSCPDTGLAAAAAGAVAAAHTHPEYRSFDIHLASPSGARWTVSDLEDRILHPASLRPYGRTHIIVDDADQMAPAAFDRLLKAVEEPGSDVLYWFCVSNADRLPITIQGRAGQMLTLHRTPAALLLPALIAAGAAETAAARIADLAGADIRLALAVAAHPDRIEDLEAYATSSWTSTSPTATADLLVAGIGRLAAALPNPVGPDPGAGTGKSRVRRSKAPAPPTRPVSVRPRWDTLTPAARADARRLLRRLLDRWVIELREAVAEADTAAGLAAVDAALRACSAARAELGVNATPSTVLAALLARTSDTAR
jgi:hypothetical protein